MDKLYNHVELSASMMCADYGCLEREVRSLEEGGIDSFHIDIMDGQFVPNLTFGPPVIKCIRKCTKLVFDVHLMIDKPERYIEDLKKELNEY